MFDLTAAKEIAARTNRELDLSKPQEIREGWFFPTSGTAIGSSGIIVNKRSGRVLPLGSAFPVARDLRAYDEGFQFELYDLVITRVDDSAAAVETLLRVRPAVVEPAFVHGTVWRIPRELRRDELASRVQRLPCIIEKIGLYFVVEALQEARAKGHFAFVLVEYRRGT